MKILAKLIWAFLLLSGYMVVGPAATFLLRQALDASRQIEEYTADMLKFGQGIAEHTAQLSALKQTIAAAPILLGATEMLNRHVAVIEAALTNRADGRGPGKERAQ